MPHGRLVTPYSHNDLLKLLGLIGAYVLMVKLTVFLFGGNTVISFLWLASGPALAALLLGGYRFLPTVFLGACLGFLLLGQAIDVAISAALRHTAVLFAGVWLLKREGRFNPSLLALGDYLRLLLLALVVGFGTLLIVLVQGWFKMPYPGAFTFYQRLAGTALGIIISMPVVLVWRTLPRGWATLRMAGEATLILGLSFLVGQVVFIGWLPDSLGQVARGYWLFLFITWAAVRLGPHGTVLILAVSAIQGLIGAQWGVGFFSNDIAKTHLANYFFYMLSLSAVGMALATYFTQKQQAVKALQNYQQHLEELVEERTGRIALLNTELQQRVDEAVAANLAKGSFLAKMSHEIRTPINGILGMTHLLGRSELTPHQRDQLSKIQRSGRHLLSIINDILDISKIEAGKLNLEVRNFAVADLIDAVLAVMQDTVHAKGLALHVETSSLPKYLLGDSNRLGQALINYLGNAVKFTERGSITLSATVENESEHGLLIRFEVADTGAGMSAGQQGRLFQAFEQADNSTTREFGGTGLGLAINKRLAQAMCGTVGVDSQPGQGSRFWLTVRLGKGREEEAKAIQVADDLAEGELKRQYRGTRLLLAEDDPINQEVALCMLRDLGLVVDLAENGARAVDMAAAGNYAVILMDMQMPELDGVEATKKIRGLPGGKSIPVIAMTANAFADDKALCFAAGMNDFVAKPVVPEHLFATLLKWLSAGVNKGAGAIAPDSGSNHEASAEPVKNQLEALAGIHGLDLELGLRSVRHKLPTYVRLLQLFVLSHGNDHELIRAALGSAQLEDARRLAHTLKGAAGILGATRIQQIAEAIELPLKQMAPTAPVSARRALDELAIALPALVAGLDAARGSDVCSAANLLNSVGE